MSPELPRLWNRSPPVEAVVIGVSSGAVDALLSLLPALPAQCRLPVLVVVHVPAEPPHMFESLFEARCALKVQEIVDKAPLDPGIYFAPPDYHLLIDDSHGVRPHLSLSVDPPVGFSRPSIDVLFESAAQVLGPKLCAVVLTGANDDGAQGLRKVSEAGGICCVQDPATAYAATMPRAAAAACPSAHVLTLAQLAALFGAAPHRDSVPEDSHV